MPKTNEGLHFIRTQQKGDLRSRPFVYAFLCRLPMNKLSWFECLDLKLLVKVTKPELKDIANL